MKETEIKEDLAFRAEINLYYDLFVPENMRNAPLLIAVHGYGAHKRHMMREARAVAPTDWAVASIQAPHQHFRQTEKGMRVGFGWLTNHKPEEYVSLHHEFILRLIDKLAAEGTIDRKLVYLYGFSQACALNFRFAFTYPEVLAGLVGVCGGIPGDLETNSDYRPPRAKTLYIYGTEDEFYTQGQFREFSEKLAGRIEDLSTKQFKANHEITDEMREEIKKFFRMS